MEMLITWVIFLFIIIVIPLCSFLIARKVYRTMKAKENRWAMLVSSITFLLSVVLIFASALMILAYNVEFSR